ncbi:MAG: 2-amino-4-hydroxy-6-hydroxymethyldihydropteridine diphosphokinase [Haliea sp.]|uniref:2-amino-4-hydroxy-6- hydroxymethyldihydropteridine diphosphokinase n=1 Tax=Haliea sp. TaxID=1932666 RepID=UPI0032EE22B9
MPVAYIALGSNLENPAQQLQAATDALAALAEVRIIAGSSVFRSAAVGPGEQPDYLNAVVALDTSLAAEDLLDRLQAIEQARGRERNIRWGPRTLDLDILLYGDQQICSPRLQVPHPAMAQRHFVLYPLAEVCPREWVLPGGDTLAALLSRCSTDGLADTGLALNYHLQH